MILIRHSESWCIHVAPVGGDRMFLWNFKHLCKICSTAERKMLLLTARKRNKDREILREKKQKLINSKADRGRQGEKWLNVNVISFTCMQTFTHNPESVGSLYMNTQSIQHKMRQTHSRRSALPPGPISHHWQWVQCLGWVVVSQPIAQ